MKQIWLTGFGAIAGAIVWLAFHSTHPFPDLLVCIVSGALTGTGIYGLLVGEISLSGHGGKSVKLFRGVTARAISCVAVAISAGFAYWMSP